MKTKDEIVQNWLPRYTGCELDKFGEYIILTNFSKYIQLLKFVILYRLKEKDIFGLNPILCPQKRWADIFQYGFRPIHQG